MRSALFSCSACLSSADRSASAASTNSRGESLPSGVACDTLPILTPCRNSTEPPSGSISPATSRSKVDLPVPFLPTKPTLWCPGTTTEAPAQQDPAVNPVCQVVDCEHWFGLRPPAGSWSMRESRRYRAACLPCPKCRKLRMHLQSSRLRHWANKLQQNNSGGWFAGSLLPPVVGVSQDCLRAFSPTSQKHTSRRHERQQTCARQAAALSDSIAGGAGRGRRNWSFAPAKRAGSPGSHCESRGSRISAGAHPARTALPENLQRQADASTVA